MALVVNFDTVASSIAGLTVTGVKIEPLTAIPTNATVLGPVLMPKPDGWLTNLRVNIDTFGVSGTEKITTTYNLTYRYLHAAIGTSLDFGVYSAMVTNIVAICAVALANDTISGAVDFRLKTITGIGPVSDPSGNMFFGCDIVFEVTEYS